MYKVIFFQDKEDAIPTSNIVEADDEESAKEFVGYIYPKCVIVSVVKL